MPDRRVLALIASGKLVPDVVSTGKRCYLFDEAKVASAEKMLARILKPRLAVASNTTLKPSSCYKPL